MPFEELKEHIILNGFEILPITFEHALKLSSLEEHHRDPFDRIMIAQAQIENLIIISMDKNIAKYNKVNLLW